MFYTILGIGFTMWCGTRVLRFVAVGSRELGRFGEDPTDFISSINKFLDKIAVSIAQRMRSDNKEVSKDRSEIEKKLLEAGLETQESQGKYILLKIACAAGGPLIGSLAYFSIRPYYATLCILTTTAIGIMVPMFWLKAKKARRIESIQRELPLVLDLTNLATSAGWDVASALERVTDALSVEFPTHPLIKELKKARWLASSGYTWGEALELLSEKLGDDTVKRTALALAQAIKQGGDRTSQLEGIAQDAHRIYYSELDKRLAGLQVKGLLVTLALFLAYMIVLLAPTAVQIKNGLGK